MPARDSYVCLVVFTLSCVCLLACSARSRCWLSPEWYSHHSRRDTLSSRRRGRRVTDSHHTASQPSLQQPPHHWASSAAWERGVGRRPVAHFDPIHLDPPAWRKGLPAWHKDLPAWHKVLPARPCMQVVPPHRRYCSGICRSLFCLSKCAPHACCGKEGSASRIQARKVPCYCDDALMKKAKKMTA